MTRLRRPVWAFLGWQTAAGPLSLPFGLLLPWLGTVGKSLTLTLIGLPFTFVVIVWLSGRVALTPSEIRAGSRLRPVVVKRKSAVLAKEGQVVWGRGLATGIHLSVHGGQSVPLPCTGWLGQDRREIWISQINEWVRNDEVSNPTSGSLGRPRDLDGA